MAVFQAEGGELRTDTLVTLIDTADTPQHTVMVMLGQLSLKGVDYVHILETWSHFISIIGKVGII